MRIGKWHVLLVSFAVVFVAYGIRYAFGLLFPEMMGTLNLSNSEMGFLYTSFVLTYSFLSIFIGFLTDLKGPRKTLLLFLPFLGLGTALIGLSRGLYTGMLFFSLAGVGASVSWTTIAYWVQDQYEERRGFTLGVLQIGSNLGYGVLGISLPIVSAFIGWRGCWILIGSLSLLLLPLIFFTSSSERSNNKSENSLSTHIKGMKEVVKKSDFLFGGLSYLLASFALMVPMTFMKAYAEMELGYPSGVSSSLFSVIAFLAIVGALLLSPLSDKVGRKTMIMLSNSIMALGLAGLGFLSPSLAWLIGWTLAVGLSYGATWPLYGALTKDFFEWHHLGTVLGAWTIFFGIGYLLSPFLGGIIVDTVGSYRPVFIIASVSSLVSIPSVWMVGKD
ncbi:hypothetical protein AKJ66_03775 [candidate division MSBL1 archaeon SCGC-AAA259E22]|uniref:Major facilitator superfamily (MFS) profile domain-containing protein n=1 Tax=candidate division MSBL1 archaeon SCGC-AAA259E22 TaxID=1698265 RepID=A0A133UEQ4_9EURY|nr:hypothetical protein AKJ66_03775 [candidate division MSBL1 archaeon SCGC-AAA259E22]